MKMTRIALSLGLAATVLLGGTSLKGLAEDRDKDPAKCNKMDRAEWKAKHEEARKRFWDELSLTPEQDTQIKSIREAFKEAHQGEFETMKAKKQELRELKRSGADAETIDAKRAEMKEAFAAIKEDRQRMMDDIKALLTPEQAAKLEARKQEHKKHPRRHDKG
jgi:periplasmic protein CpxP/Spy